MSSQAVSISTKKGAPKSGKFAFNQGPKTASLRSLPSAEATHQDRLFSLQDLKDIASIVREKSSAPAGDTKEIVSARAPKRVRAPKGGIQKVNFAKKNGKQVNFTAQPKKMQMPAVLQDPISDSPLLDMPDLSGMSGHHNPYSYAFS